MCNGADKQQIYEKNNNTEFKFSDRIISRPSL